MNNFEIKKKLLVFLDESGDISLKKIDPSFPIFAIAGAMFEQNEYNEAVNKFNNFKFKYFDHEGLILHTTEIADRTGEYSFLHNDEQRKQFLLDLAEELRSIDFKVCGSVIKKEDLKNKYAYPASPYDLAFRFIFEKVFKYACNNGFDYIDFVAESRGEKENKELHDTFEHLKRKDDDGVIRAFPRFIDQDMLDKVHVRLQFRKKQNNVIGLQVADLLVTPIAQTVFRGIDHPSLECFKDKFLYSMGISLKIFP